MGPADLIIGPGLPQLPVTNTLSPPPVFASVWLCITLFTSNTHCLNKNLPLLGRIPYKYTKLWCFSNPVERHHCSRTCCIVVSALTYVAVCSCLPPICLPLYPPIIINAPSTLAWVWQHHIQSSHSGPVVSLWITLCYIFSSTYLPCGKTGKVAFASNFCTTSGSTYVCSYISPHNNIVIHAQWGQSLSPCLFYSGNYSSLTTLPSQD